MSFLDNLIAAFSPEKAFRREAYRQAYEGLRQSYDAATYDKTNTNWRVLNESAEMTDRFSRDNVRARARDLERNSDIMNSLVGAYKRHVIGGGYSVQAKTGNPDINKQLEKAWKKWCKKQNCDVTEQQSFSQMMRMAVERKKIDGGILFVKRYTNEGFVPFKLQMFEVDELDNTVMSASEDGNKVIGGIEFNAYNKPVGYYFRQYEPDGYSTREAVRVPSKDVIFYYTKKRPSQLREMSDMAPSITRIRDINEFMAAVAVKERVEACLSVFIKKSIPTTGIGRGGNALTDRQTYEGKMLSPGMIKEMNAGDEVQVVNPNGQAADATSFTKLQQRLVGAGQGLSYEATSRDMAEATYSSARQGMIEDELTYKEDKELLMELLDEIYETFVISAVLCGAINLKSFWDDKETYLAHEWVQEPTPWIDPNKEANANATALQCGLKTYKQIAAETGRDWQTQIDDMAEVNEYAKQKGVEIGGVISGKQEESDSDEADKSGTGQE